MSQEHWHVVAVLVGAALAVAALWGWVKYGNATWRNEILLAQAMGYKRDADGYYADLRESQALRKKDRDDHGIEVARYKATVAFASEQLNEATAARERSERNWAEIIEARNRDDAKSAEAVLELTHRLEHAEQSVREGTARAVRDSEEIRKLTRDLLDEKRKNADLRGRLAKTATESPRHAEERAVVTQKWHEAARAAVEAEASARIAHANYNRLADSVARVHDTVEGNLLSLSWSEARRQARASLMGLLPNELAADPETGETPAGLDVNEVVVASAGAAEEPTDPPF